MKAQSPTPAPITAGEIKDLSPGELLDLWRVYRAGYEGIFSLVVEGRVTHGSPAMGRLVSEMQRFGKASAMLAAALRKHPADEEATRREILDEMIRCGSPLPPWAAPLMAKGHIHAH